MKRKISLWVVCVMMVQIIIGMIPVNVAEAMDMDVPYGSVASVTGDVYTSPYITNTNPVNYAINVDSNASFVITFDQPVTKGQGNIRIKDSSNNTIHQTIIVNPNNNTISINNNQVTIPH
ncbi:Ig-like domain-containing protein [Neobacillus drentensis]|uniref:Ig-like domain-containing protein n=1 Tax=Neobacillus drentensis TaxID=220684 RepID=UPI0030028E27